MLQLIIHMFHASLIPCISLDQYLNPNLYTIPNMQNMRFFCCSVYMHLTFCGFPLVETSTAGRVYDLCVYYMTGAPEGSRKVVLCGVFYGFMEKPGIEPATPGLQGIALIHYTTCT